MSIVIPGYRESPTDGTIARILASLSLSGNFDYERQILAIEKVVSALADAGIRTLQLHNFSPGDRINRRRHLNRLLHRRQKWAFHCESLLAAL